MDDFEKMDDFKKRLDRARRLFRVAVVLFAVFIALFVVYGCGSAPTLTTEQRLGALERKLQLEKFERDAANNARRTCEFAHGAGSILCN
jgi:hypothetical protein